MDRAQTSPPKSPERVDENYSCRVSFVIAAVERIGYRDGLRPGPRPRLRSSSGIDSGAVSCQAVVEIRHAFALGQHEKPATVVVVSSWLRSCWFVLPAKEGKKEGCCTRIWLPRTLSAFLWREQLFVLVVGLTRAE